ncbi:MAG: mannose-1-phosphate guanylyltransferase [Clostridiales bacterium]|nr:mannose-1-phosphate guanylyltransferase [Clostridiales bacterium]
MQRAAVIMAGGGGTRFWPVSRMSAPKQLVKLTGDDVMINETIKHYDHIIGRENTFIVTNEKQAQLMDKVLFDEVDRSQILIEPVQRNTAPCIIYAAMTLKKLYGDAVMAVLPADHHIGNIKEYERVLELALTTAEQTDRIVTIGIKPTFPSTGYGYINFGETPSNGNEVYDLLKFVEKPDLPKATEYVESGRYLWNSGMFIWKVSVILDYYSKLLPEMYASMESIFDVLRTPGEAEAIGKTYPELQKISVDYGIMEKADGVYVIPADFGWNDVGSWDSLDNVFEKDENGNIAAGASISEDGFILEGCSDSVVFDAAADKFIAAVGLKDTVIVNTKDAVLVLAKDKAQDVKKIVDRLNEQGRQELL